MSDNVNRQDIAPRAPTMKNSRVLKAILLISGLIAAGFGGVILLMPVAFYAENGVGLGGNVSLLNEIRAPGGAMLASGILVMSGAFVARLAFTATVMSAVLYLAYGLSRVLSILVDGVPIDGLVQATVLELVVGLVCLFALARYRET